MGWINRYSRWVEQHWATPTYSGWVILGLTTCFWLAAANTLAGWLYVLSGTCLALLALSIWLPWQLLKGITIARSPLYPVSVGETLTLEVELTRSHANHSAVIQCHDQVPASFEQVPWHTLEWPTREKRYRWSYGVIPQRRGSYQWQTLHLKSATPFGLFSCERRRQNKISVLVYPEVLPLAHCPILDEFSATQAMSSDQHHSNQLGQDGTTRSLRPYRHGDPRRLIHWRSSAKFNELRTRELEVIAGENPIIIALDSSDAWSADMFEAAVVTAASLYHYAIQHGMSVQLWTAGSGLQHNDVSVLETLAIVNPGEVEQYERPQTPILWLTEAPHSLLELPQGSRTLLWQSAQNTTSAPDHLADVLITAHQDLSRQLQHCNSRHN